MAFAPDLDFRSGPIVVECAPYRNGQLKDVQLMDMDRSDGPPRVKGFGCDPSAMPPPEPEAGIPSP